MGIINNTKILLKCFKSGFFSKHKQDIIGFSIIGFFLIISWVFFGLFGYIEQNNFYLLLFNIIAVVVGTFGLMILLYFLKNINYIERDFKEKIILRRKLVNVLKKLEYQINVSEGFEHYMSVMADNIVGLGIWVKQYNYKTNEYKYLFANSIVRDWLLDGLYLDLIKNKSDNNIIYPSYKPFNLSDNFTEGDIGINLNTNSYFITDVTDKITVKLKKSCRFCEYINGRYYDVLKTPFVEDNENTSIIVGVVSDVTEYMNKKENYDSLVNEGKLIPIGDTGSFYITDNSFKLNCFWCGFN